MYNFTEQSLQIGIQKKVKEFLKTACNMWRNKKESYLKYSDSDTVWANSADPDQTTSV